MGTGTRERLLSRTFHCIRSHWLKAVRLNLESIVVFQLVCLLKPVTMQTQWKSDYAPVSNPYLAGKMGRTSSFTTALASEIASHGYIVVGLKPSL